MHFTPPDLIKVLPNRQRREFDPAALQELITSIQDTEYGLLQPIVLRRQAGELVLVAGERRLRALRDILALGGGFFCNGHAVPAGQVPYVDLGELSAIAAEEAELEENIRRNDLTWQERAEATTRVAAFRAAQAEALGAPPPSLKAVAQEIRPDITSTAALDATRKEMIVARHLDDAEVRAAPNVAEAFKILKKKEERKRDAETAARVGETYTTAAHKIFRADAIEYLQGWLDAVGFGNRPCNFATDGYDIILSDPPYGMGADTFGDSGQGVGAAAHFYDDSPEMWEKLMVAFAPISYKVAKTDAHLYLFCDIEKHSLLKLYFASAGWKVFRTPIIWHNPDGFRAPWPEQGPQRKYECIFFAVKGGRKVNALKGDVLEFRKDPALGHPAQKPVALFTELLRRSGKPGDRVLDPFAGSGPILAAAHELKMSATAIEQDAAAYGIAVKRLEALNNEPELAL